ncbi:hypothetical protein GW17_00045905 [Ensete ventricosum]|nr:hypothetical protein GW17_00045905 [Ensete ventricosum]
MSLTNPLHGILDANRLTGPNYTDWLRNLRIILTTEKITYVLDIIVPTLEEGASKDKVARNVLARPRRLARGEIDFKMGNGARVAVVAIGEVTVHLLRGAIIALDWRLLPYTLREMLFSGLIGLNTLMEDSLGSDSWKDY